MIEPSKKLQAIFESAIITAKEFNHEYITIEHLVHSIFKDSQSQQELTEFGADVEFVVKNLENYLQNNLNDIKSQTVVDKPKKTHSVERVLNRCFSQVLFSGRQTMEVADIIISVLAEKNSFSFYFLSKAGITKEKFINHFQESISEENDMPENRVTTASQIDRIINQFCTNLS